MRPFFVNFHDDWSRIQSHGVVCIQIITVFFFLFFFNNRQFICFLSLCLWLLLLFGFLLWIICTFWWKNYLFEHAKLFTTVFTGLILNVLIAIVIHQTYPLSEVIKCLVQSHATPTRIIWFVELLVLVDATIGSLNEVIKSKIGPHVYSHWAPHETARFRNIRWALVCICIRAKAWSLLSWVVELSTGRLLSLFLAYTVHNRQNYRHQNKCKHFDQEARLFLEE